MLWLAFQCKLFQFYFLLIITSFVFVQYLYRLENSKYKSSSDIEEILTLILSNVFSDCLIFWILYTYIFDIHKAEIWPYSDRLILTIIYFFVHLSKWLGFCCLLSVWQWRKRIFGIGKCITSEGVAHLLASC